ncbi:MAG: addiction module protein [Planctomycetes bacterium]|nr:addiction module protein [Planctomycetota bacterium]
MSGTIKLDEIDKLSVEQRIELIERILSTLDADSLPFTAEQWKEIQRRLAAFESNPDSAQSYEQYKERIRGMM